VEWDFLLIVSEEAMWGGVGVAFLSWAFWLRLQAPFSAVYWWGMGISWPG